MSRVKLQESLTPELSKTGVRKVFARVMHELIDTRSKRLHLGLIVEIWSGHQSRYRWHPDRRFATQQPREQGFTVKWSHKCKQRHPAWRAMQTELLHLPAMTANLTEGPLSVLDVTGHEQLLGLLDRIFQLAEPHIAKFHLY